MNFQDITGQTFGRLTAVEPLEERRCGAVVWLWKCSCGKDFKSRAALVRNGHIQSCGCLRRKHEFTPRECRHCGQITERKGPSGCYLSVCFNCLNGQLNASKKRAPKERTMLAAAKGRAKKHGIPFLLTKGDIIIPEFYPILGIKLKHGTIKDRNDSPSLDRIKPELGYVPGNIAIISHYANRIKNNGTAEEHRKIADWMDSFGVSD